MKCIEIQQWLPEYSVGGLSKKKRQAFEQHLAQCPGCERELRALNKTALLLDSIPLEAAPEHLWNGVRTGLLQQQAGASVSRWENFLAWFWGRRVPALATGALLLLLVVGILVTQYPTDTENSLDTELQQYTFSQWNDPFADRAAMGLWVVQSDLEGENYEALD